MQHIEGRHLPPTGEERPRLALGDIFRAHGGNVEATCKGLVQIRMQRAGARWKQQSGQAVLSLRATMSESLLDQDESPTSVSAEQVWSRRCARVLALIARKSLEVLDGGQAPETYPFKPSE